MKKSIWIILLIVVLGSVYFFNRQSSSVIDENIIIEEDYIMYLGEDGKSVLQILMDFTEVETSQFGFSHPPLINVLSINETRPPEGFRWVVLINSEKVKNTAVTKGGDIVEWKIESQ